MKKMLSVLFLALALTLQSNGQDFLQQIRENPYNCALVFKVYEPLDTLDTPAPDGYKPFYVSHIGRHGSRYHSTRWKKTMENLSGKFNEYAEAGALTEEGLKARKALNDLLTVHQKNFGSLSPRGAEEHRQIARRMYKRVPEVFTNPKKKEILCLNSGSGRVVESQNHFIGKLKELQPDLQISCFSCTGNPEYSAEIKGRDMPKEETDKVVKEVVNATKDEAVTKFDYTRMAKVLFRDGRNTKGLSPKYIVGLHSLFIIREDIPEDIHDVIRMFTPEELYAIWSDKNHYDFVWLANCTETKHLKPLHIGGEILRCMIEDADKAFVSDTRAADLRFSHDAYIQPLLAFLSGTGNEEHPAKDANKYWSASTSVNMGVNVQLLFYRNDKKKDILVKVLHNEKEISLPAALKPVSGPYYKWEDFKKFYLKKLAER